MTGGGGAAHAECCAVKASPRRLNRQLRGAGASILPGALLVLLPKCPFCVAAWLTFVTGIGVSAAAAAHMRQAVIVFWITAMAGAMAQIIRRRVSRSSVLTPRLH